MGEFLDGDQLTLVPCNHTFFVYCMWPWFLRISVYPVCRRQVTSWEVTTMKYYVMYKVFPRRNLQGSFFQENRTKNQIQLVTVFTVVGGFVTCHLPTYWSAGYTSRIHHATKMSNWWTSQRSMFHCKFKYLHSPSKGHPSITTWGVFCLHGEFFDGDQLMTLIPMQSHIPCKLYAPIVPPNFYLFYK